MKHRRKIILVLKGGLGNQLFSYAAARRLALVNNVELTIDSTSAFKNDIFRRAYCLRHFNIAQNFASEEDLAWSLRPYKKFLYKRVYPHLLPFEWRPYLTEGIEGFDPRIYNLKVKKTVYLDGYFQSERYFADIEEQIRNEFKIITTHDAENLGTAKTIEKLESVCLHARLLGIPGEKKAQPSQEVRILGVEYFMKAIEIIASKVEKPHFFVFSDCIEWVKKNIKFDYPVFFVTHNKGDEKNYEDLWLMSLCKHFIIANSTFSWWGAWLSTNRDKVVIAPNPNIWGVEDFREDLILDNWIKS